MAINADAIGETVADANDSERVRRFLERAVIAAEAERVVRVADVELVRSTPSRTVGAHLPRQHGVRDEAVVVRQWRRDANGAGGDLQHRQTEEHAESEGRRGEAPRTPRTRPATALRGHGTGAAAPC